MPEKSTAGRSGDGVRSDCRVTFEPRDSGDLDIRLRSKVESMYGDATRELVAGVAGELGVRNAVLEIDDSGALPFALAARVECAVRRSGLAVKKTAAPAPGPGYDAATEKFRMRRSRLYLPGNEPKFFTNATVHEPDGIILDLEDSVAPAEKDAARIMVRNALCAVDFGGSERMVRINQLPAGLEDLDWIVPHNVHVVLIPKCESADQVRSVDDRIRSILKKLKIDRPVWLMPIMESALGAIRAFEVATASDSVAALAVGLEDYTADIGARRTKEGRESFWARSQVVNAARAAGVQPIDTVFSDVADMDCLRESVIEAKGLGFEGKGCIHPRQIVVVHEGFAPADAEVERAVKIVAAFEKAEAAGLGVVSLGTKMIDPPVVKRALRTVELARKTGKLPPREKDKE